MKAVAWLRGGLLRASGALLRHPGQRGPPGPPPPDRLLSFCQLENFLLGCDHSVRRELQKSFTSPSCFQGEGPASKDYSLPNASWSRELRGLYAQYMERCEDDDWERLPSFCCYTPGVEDTVLDPTTTRRPIKMSVEPPKFTQPPRFFTRGIQGEGLGFEYVTFYSSHQQKADCLFQSGPFLEGAPGFVHGGAIATMVDSIMATCAVLVSGAVMTANLNINYKSPVPLGSTIVLKSWVDRLEGRKIFITCHILSANQETLHADATSLFVKLDPDKMI
ncbi:acyl-coenzyme A thioesterase THEM4 isoform X2 [Tachyglossus aculeatus]|uniref:acyl-coenzyme A thioesterase THEM4 isoform X2 n=1 Tax=Tachyglossus aculeatus TaxID=9261 RepID=UPI0018F334A3|nr:acyl-coenzyme A thioesterase THEM4 isoform X2 [Tachyglossus aculeatus]